MVQSSGIKSVYLPARDIRSQHHYVRAGEVATINVHGPTTAKIDVRPIHGRGSTDLLDDWLIVTSGDVETRVPIISNRASQTSIIEGGLQFGEAFRQESPEESPGTTVSTQVELGPGLNQFHVSSENVGILIEVSVARPEIALPALPPINPTTLAAVIKGTYGRQSHRCDIADNECKDSVRMVCRDGRCCSVSLAHLCADCGCNELRSAKYYFDRLEARHARNRFNRVEATEQPFVVPEYDDVLHQAVSHYRTASSSLYGSATPMQGIVQLHRLAEQHPGRRDIARLLNKMMSSTAWESFAQFDDRAGCAFAQSFRMGSRESKNQDSSSVVE